MEIRHLLSDRTRATLGAQASWVHSTEGLVAISEDGRSHGGLVSARAADAAGLDIADDHGIRQARAQWGALRTAAATAGPQGLTYYRTRIAALVDQPTLVALERGRPLLSFSELELTEHGLTLADGEPVLPGEYVDHGGRTLRIQAPKRKDTTVDTGDPNLPTDMIFEALRDTAAKAAGAHMRAARAATSEEAKEAARTRMRRAWAISTDHHLTREEMIELKGELQEEIQQLRES